MFGLFGIHVRDQIRAIAHYDNSMRFSFRTCHRVLFESTPGVISKAKGLKKKYKFQLDRDGYWWYRIPEKLENDPSDNMSHITGSSKYEFRRYSSIDPYTKAFRRYMSNRERDGKTGDSVRDWRDWADLLDE